MNFQELVRTRYSVRAYKPDPIEPFLLNQILTAAQFAPTAANKQPFRLVVINSAGNQEQIRTIYDRDWFVSAPIIICACGIPSQGWVRADGKSYLDVDIAIVMDHLSLAAADLGLGTCWVASFDVKAAREFLKLPTQIEPIVLMSLGYPADSASPKIRKPLDQLVSYQYWEG
jgi:nitroreductase